MSLPDTAITVTNVVGQLASLGQKALPVATFIAGFIPQLAPIVTVIKIAEPYLNRVASAAPAVAQAIDKGKPIYEAIKKTAPSLLPDLKQIYAIAVNHDPLRPETNMKAADVPDRHAMEFAGVVLFGRTWTQEETQRWWDKAQGQA